MAVVDLRMSDGDDGTDLGAEPCATPTRAGLLALSGERGSERHVPAPSDGAERVVSETLPSRRLLLRWSYSPSKGPSSPCAIEI